MEGEKKGMKERRGEREKSVKMLAPFCAQGN